MPDLDRAIVPYQDEMLSLQAAHILAMADCSLAPTLINPRLAALVTNLSVASRLSLRASSFVVGNLLEACRISTHTGLSLTRRAIIAAVSSAQTHHSSETAYSGVPHQDKDYLRFAS